MKVFRFEERIPAVIVQFYEVIAETEEQALALVQDGKGLHDVFTDTTGPGEFELYDEDEIP